jgi:hypothetical protein
MPRFIQMLAVYDTATSCLVQRAYNDFCRDAAIQARRSGPRFGASNLVTNIAARRADENRAVSDVEDAEKGSGKDHC